MMSDRFTFYALRSTFDCEGLHATAQADVAALLDTLETELKTASFTPSRPGMLTAAAPRWDDGRPL
jgi:hypothetical protein